jgi:glycosyltransferase involved in cell wall biosynthesis
LTQNNLQLRERTDRQSLPIDSSVIRPASCHSPCIVFVFGMDARRVGGIEVHTRELAVRLGLRGWRAVLCFHRPPCAEVRQYLSLPNVIWEDLPRAWNNSWQALWNLFLILRTYRPRLLHLQFTPFLGCHAWIAKLSGVKKIVLTDHHSRPEGYILKTAPPLTQLAGRLLNLPLFSAIAVSNYNLNALASQGTFPVSRLKCIYNGVDLDRRGGDSLSAGSAFRARYGIPPAHVLITQVSQVRPEKGIEDLLEAASLALAHSPNLHFAIVGDGDFLEEYTRLSVKMGLAGRVTWTGLIADPMAAGAFAAADIVCLASRWQEAFGFVLAEAMSCEKPVIATRVGGIPEVVEDGLSGCLVPPNNPALLAEKFLLLAGDSELRLRMGLAGRRRAADLFNVATNAERLLELYGEF